jgi:hypothetical protein
VDVGQGVEQPVELAQVLEVEGRVRGILRRLHRVLPLGDLSL